MRTTWQRLLDRLASGDAVLSADDVRGWNKAEFEWAVRAGILRETDKATSVRCDACDEGHWSEVVWIDGGRRALLACPQEGPLDVDLRRLRQWRIESQTMAELMAQALELRVSIQVIELPRLWHLGRRRFAGRFRDLFLVSGGTGNLDADFGRLLRYEGWTSGVVMVPGAGDSCANLPPKLRVVDLCSVAHLTSEGLKIDLDYITDCFADDAAVQNGRPQAITAPPGTTWKDVGIVLHEAFMQATIRGKSSERDYPQAGFREPDQRFDLLKLFGAARGVLDAERLVTVLEGGSPVKKRISRLRHLLQELFEIDGNPIEHHKKANTYSCQFEIRLADDHGYPTPTGATWLDFVFHERSDGRLLVSATEEQRFAARGWSRDDGRIAKEVGQTSEVAHRIYSLEEMKLRSVGGKLTPEGTVMLDLLRGGGRLPRRSDDLTVLSLAKLLQEWTRVTGEPLQLSEASQSWRALFACSSEIKVSK